MASGVGPAVEGRAGRQRGVSMGASSAVPWLSHPMAEALLRLNFLPSTFAHPRQVEAWAGNAGAVLEGWPARVAATLGASPERASQALHRAVSRAWIQAWQLDPIATPEEPGACLCLLPAPSLDRLARYLGLFFLAPALCRVISRADLAALDAALGPVAMQFVRRMPAALRNVPTLRHSNSTLAAPKATEVAARAGALGDAVLAHAFADLPDPVSRRGLLRLSPEAGHEPLPPGVESGADARTLAHAVLQQLEPQWLSHFRDLH